MNVGSQEKSGGEGRLTRFADGPYEDDLSHWIVGGSGVSAVKSRVRIRIGKGEGGKG